MNKNTMREKIQTAEKKLSTFKHFNAKDAIHASYLNTYGRVGIEPLYSLIGLASNWKDPVGKYYYEKSKFKVRKKCSSSMAVVIYCALHLYDLDTESGHGICKNGHIGYLQELTGFRRPAIKYALQLLEELGYIQNLYIQPYGKIISFKIPEYTEMFKTAKEGGKGFINIDQDFIRTLSECKEIDLLRLTLRSYAAIDNPSLETPEQTRHLGQIRSWFPANVTNKKISELVNKVNENSPILNIEKNGSLFRVFAVDGKTCRHKKEKVINENYAIINGELEKMEKDYVVMLDYANDHNESHGSFPSWLLTNDTEKESRRVDHSRIFKPDLLLKQTCARLSANLGLDLILKALRYMCDAITLRRHEIKSYPAYITSLVQNHPDGIFSDVGWDF